MRGQSRKDARFREVIERKVPAKRRQANVIVAKDRDVRLQTVSKLVSGHRTSGVLPAAAPGELFLQVRSKRDG
jgi:hypothetical protein